MFPQQSTLPHYDVFAKPPQTLPQFGRPPVNQVARPGLRPGQLAVLSPAAAAYQVRDRGTNGLGQVGAAVGSTALAIGILVIGGALGYQAGKAMTPSGSSEKTWGWIGVPVGIFTGTLGLGIMGAVANTKD